MTIEQEAIQRLAAIVADLAGMHDLIVSRRECIDIQTSVMIAEPAAPTDGLLAHTHLRCSKCKGYFRPGSSHDCAPTVTREQAEEVELVIRSFFKSQKREVPCLGCMPAFFRAVADALDKEA